MPIKSSIQQIFFMEQSLKWNDVQTSTTLWAQSCNIQRWDVNTKLYVIDGWTLQVTWCEKN